MTPRLRTRCDGHPALRVGMALACAALLAGCAGSHRTGGATEDLSAAAIPPGEPVPVEDPVHAVRFSLPPAHSGWQAAREGSARIGDGVQVEVATFPLAVAATAASCRDTARSRLTQPRKPDEESDGPAPGQEQPAPGQEQPAQEQRPQAQPAQEQAQEPLLDGPREQAVGDAPTATWSFTRGSAASTVRSRWGFFPRGADCVLLEVSGVAGDKFAEGVFALAARSFQTLPLPEERQRDVDLLAGMRFVEQREPGSALDRFESLARREPELAKAHFGVLMAGFAVGPPAYARALPHGEAALKAERELTPEQRELALRWVGVMQLEQSHLREAAKTLAELVVRAPELDEGQYNYACALARLGDVPGALDHLRAALRLNQGLIAHAREDEDLKALHGNSVFEELTREPRNGTDPHTEARPPPPAPGTPR